MYRARAFMASLSAALVFSTGALYLTLVEISTRSAGGAPLFYETNPETAVLLGISPYVTFLVHAAVIVGGLAGVAGMAAVLRWLGGHIRDGVLKRSLPAASDWFLTTFLILSPAFFFLDFFNDAFVLVTSDNTILFHLMPLSVLAFFASCTLALWTVRRNNDFRSAANTRS